jgi:hypothetical protein
MTVDMTLHLSLLKSFPEYFPESLMILMTLMSVSLPERSHGTSSDIYNSASILTNIPGIREDSGRKRDPARQYLR